MNPRTRIVSADGQHGLGDPLLGVHLPVHDAQAERVGVERDRRVQVGHGDPHVVDPHDADVRQGVGVWHGVGVGVGQGVGGNGRVGHGASLYPGVNTRLHPRVDTRRDERRSP